MSRTDIFDEDNYMEINNVIFDLDGTILDTSYGIIESIRYTLNTINYPSLSDEKLLSFIGPPLRKSFIDFCECSEIEAQEAIRVFRSYYQNKAILHAELYDGIKTVCEMLSDNGIKLGVATNKPDRFAKTLIKNFGLEKYFKSVYGADDSGKLTKAELVCLCAEEMNAPKCRTVLIGDTQNDAIGARDADMLFVAVTYGFGFRTETDVKEYPHIGVAKSPIDIFDILMKWNGGVELHEKDTFNSYTLL